MPKNKSSPLLFALTSGLMVALTACGQSSMESTLERLNNETVVYISPEAVQADTELVLLDTRKKKEYEVSHLPGAHWVGYRKFDLAQLQEFFPNKKTPFVVYCSVGVRSEDIGEKLLEAGYTEVKNLYGGIFAWKNKGFPVFNPEGIQTEKVHAYNRRWGRLLNNAEKIY